MLSAFASPAGPRRRSPGALLPGGNQRWKTHETDVLPRPRLIRRPFALIQIYNKSRAAAGLCEFAINIIKYYDVVTMIEPKRQELREANEMLEEANTKLKAVQEKVAELNTLVTRT